MMQPMSSLCATLVIAALACGKTKVDEQPSATGTTTITAADTTGCPMAVPGAGTTVTDVEGGVALTIVVPPERVDQVRGRAQRMAAAGGMGAACPCGHMAGAPDMGMRHMGTTVPADVRVENVDGGVRLTLVAHDAKDVGVLRDQARVHTEHMKGGACPAM